MQEASHIEDLMPPALTDAEFSELLDKALQRAMKQLQASALDAGQSAGVSPAQPDGHMPVETARPGDPTGYGERSAEAR